MARCGACIDIRELTYLWHCAHCSSSQLVSYPEKTESPALEYRLAPRRMPGQLQLEGY